MRKNLVFWALILACIGFGCDSAEPAVPELSGRFEGSFTYIAPPGPFFPGGEVSEDWSLSLRETADGSVSGNGKLGADAVTASGSHEHPEVVLEFVDGAGNALGRFSGTLSDDGSVLDGVYNLYLFFVDIPVTLNLAGK